MKPNSIFFLLLLSGSFMGCQKTAQDADTARDIANIKAAYEALNRRDFDAFAALCDGENYVDVNVAPAPVRGVDSAIALYKQFMEGFPDFKLDITDIAPAGNGRYLLRLNVTGAHTGTFMGIPATGKPIKWTDADVVVVNSEGKCVSHEITRTGEALVQIGQAAMLNPNTRAVMDVYDKFGKGDIPGILAACGDEVVFDIEDPMFDPMERMFSGKGEVAKFFEELAAKAKYSRFQPSRFAADGDDVFVTVETEYDHLASGKKYASTYNHHFKVVNGKITYFRGTDGIAKPL